MSDLRARAIQLVTNEPDLCMEIAKVIAERAPAGLTPKQLELYEFVKAYKETFDIPPTFGEMARAVGLQSRSGVDRLISGLERRGLVARKKGLTRGLQIIGSR